MDILAADDSMHCKIKNINILLAITEPAQTA